MNLYNVYKNNEIEINYHEELDNYQLKLLNSKSLCNEFWFNPHKEKNKNNLYLVHGSIYEHGDITTWVEEIFDNMKQAMACEEYLNLTNTQKNVEFYAAPRAFRLDHINYIEELKELKKEKN